VVSKSPLRPNFPAYGGIEPKDLILNITYIPAVEPFDRPERGF
jgi:hypothetical protein